MTHLMFYIAAALLLCTSCITDPISDLSDSNKIKEGTPLPSFQVVTLHGDTISDTSLKGRYVFLTLFHTDCPDCRRELPVLQSVYDSLQHCPEWQMLCISRKEGHADIEKYWNAQQLTLPVAPQDDAAVYELFASSGIPRIYLADTQGIVRVCLDEDDPISQEDLHKWIRQMTTLPHLSTFKPKAPYAPTGNSHH